MAKNIQTRIGLKIDTLAKWNESTIGLLPGELAIATVAAGEGHGLTEPVIMIKIGEDGVKTFKDLPWALHAKASDVYSWAKQSEADFIANFFGMKDAEGHTLEQLLDGKFATNGELAADVQTLRNEASTLASTLRGELTTALAGYYTKGEIDKMVGDLGVTAIEGRVDDLETAVETTLPGQISAINDQFKDYTKTEDLPKDLEDFTNNAGYAKAADVYSKTEADGKFLTEHQSLANYYTKTEVDDELEKKQDVIPANTYDAYGSAAAVEAQLKDYAKTADLPTDLGDLANEAGYAKTAEVTETLKGYYTKGDIDGKVETINGAIDLKADKSVVEAMYTNEQIDALVNAKDANVIEVVKVNGTALEITDKAVDITVPTDAQIRAAAADEINTLISAADDEGGETIQKIADLVDYVEKNGAEIAQLVTDVDTANTNASNAVTTAGEAKTAAEGAATVAGEAKALAEEAKEAATNATTGAAASAEAAAASALGAKGSEDAAKGYAEAAAADADDAEAARGAAVVAQGAAEDAQEAAEGARDAAQAAQGLAEGARNTAAQHKADAEAAKGAAETAQGLAEDAKDAAVVAQGAAEDARDLAAGYKADAEAAKSAAETAQSKAEAAQTAAEQAKAAAEASNTSATAIANEAANVAGQAKSAAEKATSDVAGLTTTVNAIPTTYRKVANKITSDDMSDEVWVFNCGTATLVV